MHPSEFQEMGDYIQRIVCIVESNRCPLNDEKATQLALAELFQSSGLSFSREKCLDKTCIPDFMIGSVAVEVKIKGQRSAILRQLARYALHPSVGALLLVTGRSIALPANISGKKVFIASLSRGWL